MTQPFNRIVQLLLFTGQRRNEIASLRAEWIDPKNGTITLPSQVTKNKRQHTFPFGKMTESILRAATVKTEEEKKDKKKDEETNPSLRRARKGYAVRRMVKG